MRQQCFLISLLVGMLVFVVKPGFAATVHVSDDSFIKMEDGKDVRGSDKKIEIREKYEHQGQKNHNRWGIVRFDLSTLPADVPITDAFLRLFVGKVKSSGSVHVHVVIEPWEEATLTADNAPAVLAQPVNTVAISSEDEGRFIAVDVTAVVQLWAEGTLTNYGLALLPAEGAGVAVELDSKENKDTSHPMELEVALSVFSGSFNDLTEVPGGLADGDDDNKWDGSAAGLNAELGRQSLGLGSAAISDSDAFAPADLSGYAGNNLTYSNNQFHALPRYMDEEAVAAVEETGKFLEISTDPATYGQLTLPGPSPTITSENNNPITINAGESGNLYLNNSSTGEVQIGPSVKITPEYFSFGKGTVRHVAVPYQAVHITDPDRTGIAPTGHVYISTRPGSALGSPQITLDDDGAAINIINNAGTLQLGGTNVQFTGINPTLQPQAGNTLTLDSDTGLNLNTISNKPITAGAGLFTFGDDIKINGNNIQDSNGTTRITLGATNAISGNLSVSGNFASPNINTGATSPNTVGTASQTTFFGDGSNLSGIAPTSRTINVTSPITGGGTLDADRTIGFDGTTNFNASGATNIPYSGLAFTNWAGTFDGEEGTAYHAAGNLTGNAPKARLTNSASAMAGDNIDWDSTNGEFDAASALATDDEVHTATGGCLQVNGTGLAGNFNLGNYYLSPDGTAKGLTLLSDGRVKFNYGADFGAQTVTNAIAIQFNPGINGRLNQGTTDGADNKWISISGGGGAESVARGAYIEVLGNEYPSYPGQIWLAAGNVSGSKVVIATSNEQERITVLQNGNVGIGTNAPSSPLHVRGPSGAWAGVIKVHDNRVRGTSAATQITFHDSSTCSNIGWLGWHWALDSGRQLEIANNIPGGDLVLAVAPSGGFYTEQMRLTSDGKVGIGTNAPARKLHVAGEAEIDSNLIVDGNTIGLSSTENAGIRPLTLDGSDNRRVSYCGGGVGAYGRGAYITMDGNETGIHAGTMKLYAGYDDSFTDPTKGSIIFYTSNQAQRVKIDRAGNVGVGTTAPTERLEVAGNVKATAFIGDGSQLTGIVGVPSGVIVMWSGSATNIPSGWALCNGASSTPDLRDRFVVGAGSSYNVDDVGGAAAHTHDAGSYQATSHRHGYSGSTSRYTNTQKSGSAPPYWGWALYHSDHSHSYSGQTGDAGGGSIAGNSGSASSLPPYYALCYIMKL